MTAPSYMSLPRASELTVEELGFSYAAKARMKANGIVSALQLAELASRTPRLLKTATGVSGTKAIRLLEERFGQLPDFNQVATSFEGIPPSGVNIDETPDTTTEFLSFGSSDKVSLNNLLDRTRQDLPRRIIVTTGIQEVQNQGAHGTCVGFAANALHEFRHGTAMSAGYAYRGAKSRDGFSGTGSWLVFAMEHCFGTGHVEEKNYTYHDAILDRPISGLVSVANIARSAGHASVRLTGKDKQLMPRLLQTIIAGRLHPDLPAMPVAVSLRLYESFVSTSTALDGLIRMPLPGERTMGGHAMCIVGYVMSDDPSNPFGINYFLARNSWGVNWGCHNPFGLPGHAAIPEQYFSDDHRVLEAFICLKGPRV